MRQYPSGPSKPNPAYFSAGDALDLKKRRNLAAARRKSNSCGNFHFSDLRAVLREREAFQSHSCTRPSLITPFSIRSSWSIREENGVQSPVTYLV